MSKLAFNQCRLLLCGVLVTLLISCTTTQKKIETQSQAVTPALDAKHNTGKPSFSFASNSKMSIVHVGGNDTFNVTKDGRKAGTLLFDALIKNDKKLALQAIEVWDQIIPRENYGGEYSALQWFARYFIADKETQEKMIEDPYVAVFYHLFSGNQYAVLKEYLQRKYHTKDIGDEETLKGQSRKMWLEDTILFSNPRREEWEKTSKFMEFIDLKPGQTVADVGSGPGYFAFRFANKVGSSGKVYAIDTEQSHVKQVASTAKKMDVKNVVGTLTDGRTLGLGNKKVDAVAMCSLYHNIYAMATETERTELVESIKSALNDDGVFYLIDNGLVPPGTLPYHGPYIAKELIISQLTAYGFELIADYQPIAQRFLLVFKKSKASQEK